MERGYIKLFRKFQDNDFWKEKREFSKAEAWIDILFEINHKPGKVLIRNKIIDCDRGQSVNSIETWMDRWNWHSKCRVRIFLTLLKKLGNISSENLFVTTRITVCNYNKYNNHQSGDSPEKVSTEFASSSHRDPNKKNKNINNDKNKDNKPEPPLWKTDYDEYKRLLILAYDNFILKKKILVELEQLYADTDVLRSLYKIKTYWMSRPGWTNKKSSKTVNINWDMTFLKGIAQDFNRIKLQTVGQTIEPYSGPDTYEGD